VLKWAVTVTVIILTAVPAMAFDSQRKGFILGGGLGLAGTSFKQKLSGGGESTESETETKPGLLTDFRIGFGPSDQLLLYYFNHVTWFSIENVLSQDVTIANGVGGIGISYYFTPKKTDGGREHLEFSPFTPAWFISGGLGLSSWATPFEEGSETWSGFGLWFGGGYEFSRHWSVELTIGHGNPSKTSGGFKAESNSTTFGVSITGLAY